MEEACHRSGDRTGVLSRAAYASGRAGVEYVTRPASSDYHVEENQGGVCLFEAEAVGTSYDVYPWFGCWHVVRCTPGLAVGTSYDVPRVRLSVVAVVFSETWP